MDNETSTAIDSESLRMNEEYLSTFDDLDLDTTEQDTVVHTPLFFDELQSKWLQLSNEEKDRQRRASLLAVGIVSTALLATASQWGLRASKVVAPIFTLFVSTGLSASENVKFHTASTERIDEALLSIDNYRELIESPGFGIEMKAFFSALKKSLNASDNSKH